MEIQYTAIAHHNVYRGKKVAEQEVVFIMPKENIQEKTLSKDIIP